MKIKALLRKFCKYYISKNPKISIDELKEISFFTPPKKKYYHIYSNESRRLILCIPKEISE